MNNKKKLNKAIKSAKEENEKVSLLLKKSVVPSDGYKKIIFAYIKIVLEHHRSIIELTNVRQTSALALVRPLYEAHIRIMWLITNIGSDKATKAAMQLVNDWKDGAFPTLKVMCSEIDAVYNFFDKNHQDMNLRECEHNAPLFHSYTHGGAYLISIISNSKDRYSYKDMIDLLEHTSIYMFRVTTAYTDFITRDFILRDKIKAIMLEQNK